MVARFERTFPAPDVSGGYAAFRPFVRADFRRCCAYYCLHEFWAGGLGNYDLDHYCPVSKFPHLTRDFYNLRYACHPCNLTKSDYWPSAAAEAAGIAIVDLTVDAFDSHYRLDESGLLYPLTDSAQITILPLRLNSEHLQNLRAVILRNDWRLDASPLG